MDFLGGSGGPWKIGMGSGGAGGPWFIGTTQISWHLHCFGGGESGPGGPDHLKCIGLHAFSLCGQWGAGARAALDSLKMPRFPSICVVSAVGRGEVLAQFALSSPLECKTKTTGVPWVCRGCAGTFSSQHSPCWLLLQLLQNAERNALCVPEKNAKRTTEPTLTNAGIQGILGVLTCLMSEWIN